MTTADVSKPSIRPDDSTRRQAPSPVKPPAPPADDAGGGSRVWRILIWVVVLAMLITGGYFAWHYYQKASSKGAGSGAGGRGGGRPLPVVGARSHAGDLPIYLNALGNVSAYNTVTLRTRVDGQLMRIHFVEGQLVHQGDPLFEIDSRPYQVQLTQAQGQMAKDEATLNNARQDLARYEAAAEAISKQQIDTARAVVTSAEGTVKADQGSIDAANLNLAYTHISAPITGKIGLRMVDVGNMVHASDAAGLAVITQLQPISVTFSIAEDNLGQLRKAMLREGEEQPLPSEAWDRDDRNRIALGKLEALDNQIDPTTATVKLKAVFQNQDNALYPNQFVNIHLLVDTLKHVVLVPDSAVQRSPTETFVYVATDTPPKEREVAATQGASKREHSAADRGAAMQEQNGPKPQYVEMRPVTIGATEGHQAVIEQGLDAGEAVVTDGVDKLQPGTAVIVHFPDEASASPGSTTRGAGTRPDGRGGRGRSGINPASSKPTPEAGREMDRP